MPTQKQRCCLQDLDDICEKAALLLPLIFIFNAVTRAPGDLTWQ